MKIVDYAIAGNQTPQGLTEEIKAGILNGWQPIGGCQMVYTPNQTQMYTQAVVKYEEVPQ